METDLLFTQGVDLPGFAAYPLLDHAEGRARLEGYMKALIELGRETGHGVILESPTWVANRDRGAALGHSPDMLRQVNQDAIAFLVQVRSDGRYAPTVISANIGPRADAYAPASQMTAIAATRYHSEQIKALAETDVDVISGYTLAYPAEAIGIVQAAREYDLPVVISFTVETDGRLPTGTTLAEAIAEVDEATHSYCSYFMINCAHPDHFTSQFDDATWMQRVGGIVANASRCSHAELDEANVLDAGNPAELGTQLADLKQRFTQLRVFGGCCGTDMRHMRELASALQNRPV